MNVKRIFYQTSSKKHPSFYHTTESRPLNFNTTNNYVDNMRQAEEDEYRKRMEIIDSEKERLEQEEQDINDRYLIEALYLTNY